MKTAKWIWYFGDYEIWHSLKLHSLRQERGTDFPCFWSLANVYPTVRFKKEITTEKDEVVIYKVNGKGRISVDGFRLYEQEKPFVLPAGHHNIEIDVINEKGLPSAYLRGETFGTDETWQSTLFSHECRNIGCNPEYTEIDDNVEVFPFSYERINPKQIEFVNNGYLYDFGKETFGYVIIEDLKKDCTIYYGESREEALSKTEATLFEKVNAGSEITLCQRAFRYIFIDVTEAPRSVYANYEFLSYKDIGNFSCDDELVKRIYEVCAYTFRLCSREFYLDGIKRDRWVWSGDAYQSFMINRYLCGDNEIVKRTIIALLGKPPYFQHINTINDYSMYLILSVYDYYYSSGDVEFIRSIYHRVKELFLFIVSRLDENGFVYQAPGDWIFIDWGDMDKEGPVCAEQILLYKSIKAIKSLALLVNDDVEFAPDEEVLRQKIYKFFYKKELGGFIDAYKSGKNEIHRQQNIFAILYDFATKEEQQAILENVLLNEEIVPIKTPYFKFFELLAICKAGRVDIAQRMLDSYWGGMLNEGATTFWEQYDAGVTGVEKYKMYDNKFDKSLCHAWGSGPVRFLGEFVAGVKITSIGGKTFEVNPNPGIYKEFSAVVPIRDGFVEVAYHDDKLTVFSNVSGGTVYYKGNVKPIKVNSLIVI